MKQNKADGATEREYMDVIRTQTPDGVREVDVVRWSDDDGKHVDVVLARQDHWEELVNGTREKVPMTCVSWVVGDNESHVCTGDGDDTSFDVTTYANTYESVRNTVSAAVELLQTKHLDGWYDDS